VVGVHVVHMSEHFLSFVHHAEVEISNTEVEESKCFVIVLRAHQEHNTIILPHLKVNVNFTGALEHELVLNGLTGQVGNSNSFLVEFQSILLVLKLVVRMTSFAVTVECGVVHVDDVLVCGDGLAKFTFLNLD
jgi:hypothetical protein